MNPSSISRRIKESAIEYLNKDYESSLVHYFPALDKTAKRRRPKDGVGDRIRKFLKDQEVIISAIAFRNILKNCNFDGMEMHDVIYKYGRTSIAHEGELDARLKFNDNMTMSLGPTSNLPVEFIIGLQVIVIIAPENRNEWIDVDLSIGIFDKAYKINELWGSEDEIKKMICNKWGDNNLFR